MAALVFGLVFIYGVYVLMNLTAQVFIARRCAKKGHRWGMDHEPIKCLRCGQRARL